MFVPLNPAWVTERDSLKNITKKYKTGEFSKETMREEWGNKTSNLCAVKNYFKGKRTPTTQ